MGEPEIVMVARTPSIAEWVADCAARRMSFDELCQRVAARGFKTTSLYEAVRAAEDAASQGASYD